MYLSSSDVYEKFKLQYTGHTAIILYGGENVILIFYKWGNWDSRKSETCTESHGIADTPV